MSMFYGLEIARKGLTASQKGLEVSGHNIANASTPGYSRQRLSLNAVEPPTGYMKYSNGAKGRVGGGVNIITVDQIRNPFLDRQFRNEETRLNYYSGKADGLAYVEALFDELNNANLSDSIADFRASISEVAKDPTNREFRTNMLQNAIKMTETFQHYSNQLIDKQAEQNSQVSVLAGQVNDLARSISDLNLQIASFELSGQKANDLRDQRNMYLDELSGLTDISYSYDNNDYLTVKIGSDELLSHGNYTKIIAEPDSTNASLDPTLDPATQGLFTLRWESGDNAGDPVEMSGGKIKAILDMRDGDTTDNLGIPWVLEQLDKLASTMAVEFNKIHVGGYTLPNGGIDSVPGGNFFNEPGNTPPSNGVTAGNFAVSDDIKNNVFLIAASSEAVDPAIYNQGNSGNMDKMSAFFDRVDVTGIGSVSGFLKGILGNIAVETSQANKMLSSQNVLRDSISLQRESVSGVSLDEEMTNIIKFQHSYAAASRMITAIDQNLDVLINKTGLVGR